MVVPCYAPEQGINCFNELLQVKHCLGIIILIFDSWEVVEKENIVFIAKEF